MFHLDLRESVRVRENDGCSVCHDSRSLSVERPPNGSVGDDVTWEEAKVGSVVDRSSTLGTVVGAGP